MRARARVCVYMSVCIERSRQSDVRMVCENSR